MIVLDKEKEEIPRYIETITDEIKAALSVQHVVLNQSRRILDDLNFIEVLAPVIKPSRDPFDRRSGRVSNDYFGAPNWLTSNMLIYKQALIRTFDRGSSLMFGERVYTLSKVRINACL